MNFEASLQYLVGVRKQRNASQIYDLQLCACPGLLGPIHLLLGSGQWLQASCVFYFSGGVEDRQGPVRIAQSVVGRGPGLRPLVCRRASSSPLGRVFESYAGSRGVANCVSLRYEVAEP